MADDCPDFEYDDIPGARERVRQRVPPLLHRLFGGSVDTLVETKDARPTHTTLFEGLAPAEFPMYVGNYRGDTRCRCLSQYRVTIASDPRVGYPPEEVERAMADFAERAARAVGVLDGAMPLRTTPPEQKLYTVVVVACRLFEEFLRIHPYANGNGHMGRWLVCVLLARYGYWPRRWTVEPRPPDPPYSALIRGARDGDYRGLEQFVLSLLKPAP